MCLHDCFPSLAGSSARGRPKSIHLFFPRAHSGSGTQWALHKPLLNESFIIYEALIQSNLLNDSANEYEINENNYIQENYIFLRYSLFFPILLDFISSPSSYFKNT